MANLLFSILSTFNDKGLKKASKQVSLFEKQTKSLQATFLKTFSAIAILNYSKKAVNAFMADEKAAKSLELQLKNTGFEFASPYVEYFIANLEKTTGILDDELRPAFQKILTVTGSVTKSQNALSTALNISAAGYGSVEQISVILAKAYAGQTTALGKLGTGLSKATLKTGNMEKIMAELNQKFAGQSAARLDTYAGKMDLLKASAARASETIGKGLLDALSALGKNNSIADTTKKMEGLATGISNLIVGLGVLGSKLSEIGNSTGLSKVLSFLYKNSIVDLLTRAGAGAAPAAPNIGGYSGIPSVSERIRMQEEAARKKLIASIKAEEALKKLKDKYDVERIGLMAALNFATDDATKLKIAEKLAILDGNAAKAGEYLATRNAEQALEEFATKTETATTALLQGALYFRDWVAYRAGERGDPGTMSNVPLSGGGGAGGGGAGGGGLSFPSQAAAFNMGAVGRGEYAGDVYVSVAGSVLAESDLTDTISRTILQINKMGRGTTPAGGLSGGT